MSEKKTPKNKEKNDFKEGKQDLNIYPIDYDDSKLNQGETAYPLSSPVHFHIIVGRVKSGKSVLLNNLYLSKRFYGDDFKVKILISSTAYNDAVNKYMLEDFDFVFSEYTEELLDEILDMIEKDEGDGRFLLLLDDIIDSTIMKRNNTTKIDGLISRYRHIGNGEVEGKLSIALATQYFKYISVIARNNATAYYIMGHLPEAELLKISESLSYFGGSSKEFLRIYNESKKEPYDFLYLSVEHLEARRNHGEILWTQEDNMNKEPLLDKEDNDENKLKDEENNI
tara:strand:+ start:7216 stop:8064 length:849 start_codon:yes stop_codon:yes gene_type:complete